MLVPPVPLPYAGPRYWTRLLNELRARRRCLSHPSHQPLCCLPIQDVAVEEGQPRSVRNAFMALNMEDEESDGAESS